MTKFGKPTLQEELNALTQEIPWVKVKIIRHERREVAARDSAFENPQILGAVLRAENGEEFWVRHSILIDAAKEQRLPDREFLQIGKEFLYREFGTSGGFKGMKLFLRQEIKLG